MSTVYRITRSINAPIELIKRIQQYAEDNGIKSFNAAVILLLEKALGSAAND